MNLYEYQGKDAFSEGGIPVPRGIVVSSSDELAAAADEVGMPCVVKAQVLHGGRGKAGLIQMAGSREELNEKADRIWSETPDGTQLLLEEKLRVERELYVAVTPDPASASALFMLSARGGVDIEQLAATEPDSILKESVHVFHGMMPFHVRNMVGPLGLDKAAGKAVGKVAGNLYNVFRGCDATLAEINPLVLTADGRAVAADAKLVIDDNALYRQPFERVREGFTNDVEYEAAEEGIPYLQFDGDIGLMCAGAGLTNTVYDLIHYFGGKPANFLEFGGPNYRKALEAMRLTLKSNASVILIVTFGTIARADVMAEGVANAIKELKPTVPIVTAIRGTNEEKAADILRGVDLEPLQDTEEAVKKAVELAARQRGES